MYLARNRRERGSFVLHTQKKQKGFLATYNCPPPSPPNASSGTLRGTFSRPWSPNTKPTVSSRNGPR